MRIAQIGLGSMGKRRLRCLRANGVGELLGFDKSAERREQVEQLFGIQTAAEFEEVLDWGPDALVVSVPGRYHMDYLLEGARAGKHLFVEVPTALAREGIGEVRRLAGEKRLVVAQGCQLFFHPDMKAFREAVAAPSFGKVLAASYTMGTYLPDWHTYEKITDFYASDIALGGGNIDVIFQELIWLNAMMASPMRTVGVRSGRSGGLPLAAGTPDHIEMVIEYESGAMLNLHFDLLDRSHESYLRFAGEGATAVWSKGAYGRPLLYDASEKRWRELPKAEGYDYEQSYVAEIAHWVACLEGKESWPISLDGAEEIVGLVETLLDGRGEGMVVALGDSTDA